MEGIYKISSRCKPERIYIGSAVNLSNRWAVHKYDLKRQEHASIKLQRHVNKYGIEDLDFNIIETCLKEELIQKEQEHLDKLNPYFNTCKIVGSHLGMKCSEESKDKMSKSHIRQIAWNRGIPVPEEQKLRMGKALSKILKGRAHSEEHNRNNGLARRKPILQYDKEMNFIREWDSATLAGKELNINGMNINHCLQNDYGHKTAGGYIWKRK